QNISEETSRKIDAEIRKLVEAGYAEASKILEEKRADLEPLARGLLEFETLTGDEINDLLAGKRPVRESIIEPTTPRSSAVPSAGKGRPPRPRAAPPPRARRPEGPPRPPPTRHSTRSPPRRRKLHLLTPSCPALCRASTS